MERLDLSSSAADDYETFVAKMYNDLSAAEQDKGAQVFSLKEYRGKKSGHLHKIDVSLEILVTGVRLILLIECKCYKRRVEIGEVLEFAQRIDDIAAHKGIMVTTVGYQDGAFKVARANGIALIVAVPHKQIWHTRLESRVDTGSKVSSPRTPRAMPVRYSLEPRNIASKELIVQMKDSDRPYWGTIIDGLLPDARRPPHNLSDYDYYAALQAAERNRLAAEHALVVQNLNNEAGRLGPPGKQHVFKSSKACSICGLSLSNIRARGRWTCLWR